MIPTDECLSCGSRRVRFVRHGSLCLRVGKRTRTVKDARYVSCLDCGARVVADEDVERVLRTRRRGVA